MRRFPPPASIFSNISGSPGGAMTSAAGAGGGKGWVAGPRARARRLAAAPAAQRARGKLRAGRRPAARRPLPAAGGTGAGGSQAGACSIRQAAEGRRRALRRRGRRPPLTSYRPIEVHDAGQAQGYGSA